jgi:hypothetical protein
MVFAAIKMSMFVFWIVTPSELVSAYRRFGKKHISSIFRAEVLVSTYTAL